MPKNTGLPINASFTILRSDYLQIVQSLIPAGIKITRTVQFCAAKLVQIFERLAMWKKATYSRFSNRDWFWIPIFKSRRSEQTETLFESEGVERPFRSLHDELQGEHGRDVIRSALNFLERSPLLSRQHNPYNAQDRTWWYQLDLAALEALKLAQKHLKPIRGAIDDIQTFNDEIPTFNADISSIIIENNSKNSPKTTIAVVVEKSEEEKLTRSCTQPPVEIKPLLPNLPVKPKNLGGDDLISSDAAAALAELKIELNSSVRKAIKENRHRVEDAIACVRQDANNRWVMNPGGLFVSALRQGRKPKPEPGIQNGADRVFVAPQVEPEKTFEDLLRSRWSILQVKQSLGDLRGIGDSLDGLLKQGEKAMVERLISGLRSYGLVWEIRGDRVVRRQSVEIAPIGEDGEEDTDA